MSSMVLIIFINIYICVVLALASFAILLWLWWLVPNIIKFTLWFLVILVFVAPIVGLWHLGLALVNFIVFFVGLAIFLPVRHVVNLILTSLSFVLYLLRLALVKVYRYTSRYFIFSFSINILFDDLDLYWVEVLRDWLYPNDDRYRLIYRRWVFWVNNDKYQERYEYYVTFLWGYLARNFTMALYLGWFYSLRFLNRFLMTSLGTTLGSALVFFSLCVILVIIKILPAKFAEFFWLAYRFLYRQIYYLTGSFIIFEVLRTFNWNWMEWDVSSNVDEFEEADYTLAREPSSWVIRFFHIINSKGALFRRHGLNTLNIYVKNLTSLSKLLLQLTLWLIELIFNLMVFCLTVLAQVIPGLVSLHSYLVRNFNWELIRIATFKELFMVFGRTIAFGLYSIVVLGLTFLKPFFSRYVYKPVFFIPALLFYGLVKFWRVFFLVPLGFVFVFKLTGTILFRLRAGVLIIFLFLIFSKDTLSFFYFFSLGWLSDTILSALDNVALIQHKFYMMPYSNRIWRGRRRVETQVYVLFWMREFLDALFTYKYYLLHNLQTLLRLRNFWKQVTGWKPWIFFIRFMPFFGQTTLVKKIWFERMYLWLHTPAALWWCYSGYDRLFRISWFISIIVHLLIFLPGRMFYSWFFYVHWLTPSVYKVGARFYGMLGEILLNFSHLFSYLGIALVFIKQGIMDLLLLLIKAIRWVTVQLLIAVWALIKIFWAMLWSFSWVHLLYIYLCIYEIYIYWQYCITCYWWGLNIMLSDFKHWIKLVPTLFSSWIKFYFMYGFFFSYLSYNWNSFYDWLITNKLTRIYWYFPSIYYLVALTDYLSLKGNPAVYHIGFFLRAQALLDSACISLQLPRDVQRRAYIFLRRRVINVKFLRWLLPLRRTPMYSLDRWLMPVFSYFKVLGLIHLSGDVTFSFLGPLDMHMLRIHFPGIYYGFIWNSYGVYFFMLLITLILSKDFTQLLFRPFSSKIDENREYAWKRFREEHPRNLKWMFYDLRTAIDLQDRVKSFNDLPTKFFYYEQLLKNATSISSFGSLKNAMVKFYHASFWIPRAQFLYSEQDVFISPLFFDFYLKPNYVNFRTTIHKGDDLFIYFSAYAFSLNPWIHVAWDSADQEDYQVVGEEVTFHGPSRREFMTFHEKVRGLQHSLDQLVFSGKLSAWTLLKEPLNMSLIKTSFGDDLGTLRPQAAYFSHLNDIYEFEDDEDMMYVSWPFLAWFCAIPFMLFYKSFLFLSGYSWHYNRHSPTVMQSYVLYFYSVLGHIQLITYMRKLMGDNYFLHKREGGTRGTIHQHHYRSYIRNVIRKCFYSYKLPYRGTNSWITLDKIWNLKTVSFRFQFLSYSILEEIRFINLVLLAVVFFTGVLVFNDETGWRKRLPPLGYPINLISHSNFASVKKALKHVYLWFWR